eukprot:9229378-Pyramimonas_sp.AAC.1
MMFFCPRFGSIRRLPVFRTVEGQLRVNGRSPGNGSRSICKRGSMQTGVSQSAGFCRILQGQG